MVWRVWVVVSSPQTAPDIDRWCGLGPAEVPGAALHVLHPTTLCLMYFCTNVTVHNTWQFSVHSTRLKGSAALVQDDQWLRTRDFAVLTFAE